MKLGGTKKYHVCEFKPQRSYSHPWSGANEAKLVMLWVVWHILPPLSITFLQLCYAALCSMKGSLKRCIWLPSQFEVSIRIEIQILIQIFGTLNGGTWLSG